MGLHSSGRSQEAIQESSSHAADRINKNDKSKQLLKQKKKLEDAEIKVSIQVYNININININIPV